jgi:hypothetical protein
MCSAYVQMDWLSHWAGIFARAQIDTIRAQSDFANPLLYIWNNSHEQLYLLMLKRIYMCSNWLVIVLTLFRTWFIR